MQQQDILPRHRPVDPKLLEEASGRFREAMAELNAKHVLAELAGVM